MVSFINNKVSSEGKPKKGFFKNEFNSFNGAVYLSLYVMGKTFGIAQQIKPLLLFIVINAWFMKSHKMAEMKCCITVFN